MIRCAMNSGSERYMFNGIRVLSVLYVVIRSLQKYCHTSEWLTPSARLHEPSNGTDSTRPNAQSWLVFLQYNKGYQESNSGSIVLGRRRIR